MARSAIQRVDPFDRQLEVMLGEITSPEARSRRLAEAAQVEIDKADAINRAALGATPSRKVYVDGREGAPLASVQPGGRVFAEWALLPEAVQWIGQRLRETSPVRSGRYRQSHILLVDGTEFQGDGLPPEAEQYVFANVQPYARKIERGLSQQAPSGVYEVVATMAQRRFGNVARIRFTYRSLSGISALEGWAQRTNMMKVGRRTMTDRERQDWLRRQPAIIVESY